MEKSESSPSKKDPEQRMNEITSAMSSLFSETSKIPKSGDAKRFFDKKLNSSYELESQFKKDSWVWITGLNGAKELNGMLGQIVKYSEERQRYQVFVPGHDSNGFGNFYLEKNWVSDAILANKQDIAKIRKLFQWEDETTSTGSHMKLIKLENLKVYDGKLVECQYVASQPFASFKSYWYPREHPMFTVKEGNTPILNRCGFPLIIVRSPNNRPIRSQPPKDNQFEPTLFFAELLADVQTGLVPPEWEDQLGPILAYRPQHHHFLGPQIGDQSDVQHFNSLDGEIVWDFMSNVMMLFGEDEVPVTDKPGLSAYTRTTKEKPVPDRDFTFENLRNFTEVYCLNNTGLSQNYQGTEGQNITLGAF